MAAPKGPRLKGQQLVEKLNEVVAQLIKENRKLKRQVNALSHRGTSAASGTIDRSLRTIQRRVQKALTSPPRRRRRRPAANAAKKVTRRTRAPKAVA
jgi:septum formation inhibitor MinC